MDFCPYEGETLSTVVDLVYLPHKNPAKEDGCLSPFLQTRHLKFA